MQRIFILVYFLSFSVCAKAQGLENRKNMFDLNLAVNVAYHYGLKSFILSTPAEIGYTRIFKYGLFASGRAGRITYTYKYLGVATGIQLRFKNIMNNRFIFEPSIFYRKFWQIGYSNPYQLSQSLGLKIEPKFRLNKKVNSKVGHWFGVNAVFSGGQRQLYYPNESLYKVENIDFNLTYSLLF